MFSNRITDFGESREGLDNTQTMTMTRGVGSPYYMAPEMIRGDKKYTRAVDIYSYGILCVELWNQRLPYSEMVFDNPFVFASYVEKGNRPAIDNDCPPALSKLISECWDQNRQQRPPFGTVVEKLIDILDGINKNTPKGAEHVKPRAKSESQDEKIQKARVEGIEEEIPEKGHKSETYRSHDTSNDLDFAESDVVPLE